MTPQKPLERFTIGRQPCQEFLRGDADIATLGDGNRRNLHQCPVCCGNRAWCDHCATDHHDGGWETCKPGAYDYVDPEDIEDIVAMARAAKADERLSDGALYGKLADRVVLLQEALKDIEFIVDGKEDADDGIPNDAMKIMSVVQTALRGVS